MTLFNYAYTIVLITVAVFEPPNTQAYLRYTCALQSLLLNIYTHLDANVTYSLKLIVIGKCYIE